jgi:hypothetical protein
MPHAPRPSVTVLRIALFCFAVTAGADNPLPRIADSSLTDTTETEVSLNGYQALRNSASDSSIISQQSTHKALLGQFGEFHRLKGIYGLLVGTFGILAGVVLLDKADSVPLAVTSMSLGGVSIGLGLWEIKLGSSLMGKETKLPTGPL